MSWESAGHVPPKKKKKVAFGIPLKKKTACMAAIEKDDKETLIFATRIEF